MSRYFIDTEFIDTGRRIDLISIGIVSEDGQEYYAQSIEFDYLLAIENEWLKENVVQHLHTCDGTAYLSGWLPINRVDEDVHRHQQIYTQAPYGRHCIRRDPSPKWDKLCPWRTREQIRNEVYQFIHENGIGGHEFWGWCSAYDFVALCQLFGTMMDLPPDWPHYMHDIQHVLDERGILDGDLPAQETGLHNALDDAKHLKKLWGYVVRGDAWQ